MGGMTRMHFEAIAEVFNSEYNKEHDPEKGPQYEDGFEDAVWRLTSRLASRFERFNPNFDRDKFIDACWRKKRYDS